MYIPAFLPCPRCNGGPNIEPALCNSIIARCLCGFCKVGFTNKDGLGADKQKELINRAWNQQIRDSKTTKVAKEYKIDLKPIA